MVINNYSSDWYNTTAYETSLSTAAYNRIDHLAVGVKIVQIFCTNDKETMNLELIFMIENFIFKLGCSNNEKSIKMRSKQHAYTHVVKST